MRSPSQVSSVRSRGRRSSALESTAGGSTEHSVHTVVVQSPRRATRKRSDVPGPYNRPVSTNTFFKSFPLYDEQFIQPWQRGNSLIHSYYRCHYDTKQCLLSIFTLHNETFNVWLHLLGFIFLLAMSVHILSHLGLQEKSDYVVFSLFEVCSLFMLGSSSVYHTFSGHHSEKVHNFVLGMDYFGITLMIVGSFLPPVFYLFACMPFYRNLYIFLICTLGLASTLGPAIVEKFAESASLAQVCDENMYVQGATLDVIRGSAVDSPTLFDAACRIDVPVVDDFESWVSPCSPMRERRGSAATTATGEGAEESAVVRFTRLVLYITMVVCGLMPFLHIMSGIPQNELTRPIVQGLLLMLLFYSAGAFVYLFRFPEVLFPGYFDLLFSSHQIWHFFVLVAAVVHYFTCMGVFQLWRVSGNVC